MLRELPTARTERLLQAGRRVIAHLLVFGALGPLVGSFAFFTAIGLMALALEGYDGDSFGLIAVLLFPLLTAPFAYWVGGLAALGTGLAAAAVPRFPRPVFALTCGTIGAAASAALLRGAAVDTELPVLLAATGFCAGAACGWAAFSIGSVWSPARGRGWADV